MRKILNALRITLSLRNTININEILHGIRSLPFFGKYISERIYGIRVFKILAMIVSVNVEIFKAFFAKAALFAFLFFASGAISSYGEFSHKTVYLYGFLVLCLTASFVFSVFGISQETEYGVFLMGMDAKNYVMARLVYKCLSVVAGYAIFGISTAILSGVNWYLALLIPIAGVGFKVLPLGLEMAIYSAKQSAGKQFGRKGLPISVSGSSGLIAIIITVLLFGGMIATPFVAKKDPFPVLALIFCAVAAATFPGILLIKRFPYGLYRTALFAEKARSAVTKKEEYKRNHGYKRASIDNNTELKTRSKGYNYLNEIFEKRHKKVLLGRLIWTIVGTGIVIGIASYFLHLELKNCEDFGDSITRYIFTFHPGLFTLILLFINSGSNMSHAMFSSCDSSLLMYGFYKKPDALRKMFRIRIVSVVKYNFIPALMMSVFGVVAIALTGGEEYPMQYFFTVLMIMVSVIFFSMRHLAIYYLLQPYTSDFLVKSKLYFFLSFLIFLICFVLIFIKVSAMVLSGIWAVITIGYFILADILIYRFGPRTFRVK